MTPKEKALELVIKMKTNLYSDGYYDAKACALICVYELISILPEYDIHEPSLIAGMALSGCSDYWEAVKQEIKNL